MRFRIATVWLYLLLAPAAPALTTNSWFAHAWRMEDGLPDNIITGVAQTPDGFLWIGTPSGLTRFDGSQFEKFSSANLPRVPNRTIRAMTLDHRGHLWLGMDRGVIVCLDGVQTRVFSARDGLPDLYEKNITEDGEGAIWISYVGARHGVSRIKDGRVANFDTHDGLPQDGLCWLTTDATGQLWFAKGYTVGVFRNGHFQSLLTLAESPASIAAARPGGIWICTPRQLLKYDGHGQPQAFGALPEADAGAGVMLEDRNGALWIATGIAYGLFRFDGRSFEQVPVTHPVINCLLEDREGNLWAGTAGGGLDRLRPGVVELLNAGNAQPFDSIHSLCEDGDGSFWAVDRDGFLTRQQGDDWLIMNSASNWPGGRAACVASSPGGPVWIGTHGTGLYRFQDNRFKTWRKPAGLTGESIRSLLVSSNGDLWIGADSPRLLQKFHDGVFQSFELPPNARSIRAMAQDTTGNVWVATAEGLLLRVSGDHLVNATTNDLAKPFSIRCLCATPDGGLWIGYADGWGLGRLKGGKYSRITTAQGLDDDYISQIVADRQGWLWMCGSHGFFRVSLQQLNAVADGRENHVRSIIFGSGEGLPGLQANYDNYPAAFCGHDGRLCFATRTGIAVIDPKNIRDNPTPPLVLLERMAVDGQTTGRYDSRSPLRAPEADAVADLRSPPAQFRLPPNYRKLEFDFAALSFTAPENVQFRYRLDGLDTDWTEAGAGHSASYPRLPAGNYRFRVIACNNSGVWNNSGAVLSFIVRPFFWQAWWFQSACVAVFTLLVIAVVRYVSFRRLRLRLRALSQQAALDKERTRIARDLHDDLGGSLTQATLLLERTRSALGAEANGAGEKIQQCSGMVRQVAKSVDEIIWAINPRNDTLRYVVDYISQFAVEYLHAASIRCRIDLPDRIPNLAVSPEARHHLLLVVKETLNNIARHSRATEVRLAVRATPEHIGIVIEDNGHGFAAAPDNATADGLRNMRQRMEEIGGRFEITSAPDTGTRVSLEYHHPPRR